MRNSLKNKILIITLLILSFITLFSIANNVQARGVGDNIEIHGKPDFKLNSLDIKDENKRTVTVYSSSLTGRAGTPESWSRVECGPYVYCINNAAPFGGDEAKLKLEKIVNISIDKITIEKPEGSDEVTDSKKLKYAQALAYLLNEDNSDKDLEYPAPAQVALWAFIDFMYNSDVKPEDIGLYNVNQNPGGDTYIVWTAGENAKITSCIWGEDHDKHVSGTDLQKASKIFENAINIINGTSSEYYSAKFYVFSNGNEDEGKQPVLMLHSSSEQEGIPGIKINIKKVDAQKVDAQDEELILTDATFTITAKQGENIIDSQAFSFDEIDSLYKYVIEKETLKNNTDPITITIEETNPPTGYSKPTGKIKIKLEYKDNTWKLLQPDSSQENMNGLASGRVGPCEDGYVPIDITVKNEKANLSLRIDKKSSLNSDDKNLVDGTLFKIDLTNTTEIKVLGKYISKAFPGNSVYTLKKEDGEWYIISGDEKLLCIDCLMVTDGEIIIEEIKVANTTESVNVTIEETAAKNENYAPISKFNIEAKWDRDEAKIISKPSKTDEIGEISVVNDSNDKPYRINVPLINYPLINIEGDVWEDGQTGIKPATPRNGKCDSSEEKLDGIKVYLYKGNSLVKEEGKENPVTTKDGHYKFESIKYQEGLYVVFEYDGINYIETNGNEGAKSDGFVSTGSNAREVGRDSFNAKFTTIDSTNKCGDITLVYDEITEDGIPKSVLITKDGDIVRPEFVMKASSETITADDIATLISSSSEGVTFNINCGLTKRQFDLDLTNNLEFVNVKVNGKSTNYEYDVDENGTPIVHINEKQGGDEEQLEEEVTYTQYIYESDYNYGIDDYTTIGNNLDKFTLTGDENGQKGEKSTLKENVDTLRNNGIIDGLEVYATYEINFINQSNLQKAKVNKFKDYFGTEFEGIEEIYFYDKNDKKVTIKDEDWKNTLKSETKKENYDENIFSIECNLSDYNKPEYNENGMVEKVYIKFKVNTDKLQKDEALPVSNIAEITSYSTDNGYVDMNSAPGNAINSDGSTKYRYEDDTDSAGLLNIIVDSSKQRTLQGIVWDDTDKNGIYDGRESETLIDGVTVQLVELREITVGGSPYQLEYIWQETTTGSNQVKVLSEDGENITLVENELPEEKTGQYQFIGYIPGNYIVRYKYGKTEANINAGYDGNAYQSTVDATKQRYTGKYDLTYDITGDGNNRYSDAFDNEARRLEEMSIFAGETIKKDPIKDLDAHWMCADTNEFALHVEKNNNESSTTNQQVTSTSQSVYSIDNLDFGLRKRPETIISLEKHLTGLSVNVNGEGKILDATVDLEKWKENDGKNLGNLTSYFTGTTTNLSPIISERDNKGFWKLETDVNELMNGAELTAEYTYFVFNNGDEDYLSKRLMDAYHKLAGGLNVESFDYELADSETVLPVEGAYGKLLSDCAKNTKANIKAGSHTNGYYLGNYYYTGAQGANDSQVTVRVDKIEELLNNEFKFDDRINESSYGDGNNNFKVCDTKNSDIINGYDRNGNPMKLSGIVVQSEAGKSFLGPKEINCDKKILLTKTLNTSDIKNMAYDSYIAEILSYSVASGRRDTGSTPGNLSYSHSDAEEITLASIKNDGTPYNESDEFWGETIIITAPTGEDKGTLAMWITLGTVCAIIIAGGIFGIKKFVLKH